jgi:hypothetical protein
MTEDPLQRSDEMIRAKWSLFFVVVALSGCVTYTPPAPSPPASSESDAQAKQFLPPQSKGDIYVARPSEFVLLGKSTPYAVTVDGKQVGGLMPGMYYCIALEPGNHALSASSEGSITNVTVPVEAGKNYYYQLTASNASDNTVKLSLGWVILEPMGKLMIQNNKRAQGAIE